MKIADDWSDYKILATSDGMKLEDWNGVILLRPDPQVIWTGKNLYAEKNINAVYHRSEKGGGAWEKRKDFPAEWTVSYRDLKFKIKPMGFKHTGLFPEQAVNWNEMTRLISSARRGGREIKVLNLFAYTGAASVACAKAGAAVTHGHGNPGTGAAGRRSHFSPGPKLPPPSPGQWPDHPAAQPSLR